MSSYKHWIESGSAMVWYEEGNVKDLVPLYDFEEAPGIIQKWRGKEAKLCKSFHLIYVEGGHEENLELQVKCEEFKKQNQGR